MPTLTDSDTNLRDLVDTLKAASTRYRLPIIFSTHPRTMKRLESAGASFGDADVHLLKPLGVSDYVKLQSEAFCTLSDSDTITDPRLPRRDDPPGARAARGDERGHADDLRAEAERVLEAIDMVRRHHDEGWPFRPAPDYDADDLSAKVVRIILSYTDYVDRTVWMKH